MDKLPKEMLLEILQYCDAKELLALTETCRTFSTVISDSESVKKFRVWFRKTNGAEMSIGQRCYEQLKITAIKRPLHFVILSNLGSNITDLLFSNGKQKLDTIRRVLILCPSVKRLAFHNIELSDVPNVLKQPFPDLWNVNLTCIQSDPRIYKIMRQCTITHLQIHHKHDDGYWEFIDLINMLITQPHLTHLTLDGLHRTSIFDDNRLESADLRLTSLTVTDCTLNRTDHFKSFLGLQCESIRSLTVRNIMFCDLSGIILKCHQLERLELQNIGLRNLNPVESIKELTLIGIKDTLMFENFSNVRYLKLKNVPSNALEIISKNLKNLERIDIAEGPLSNLIVPTLKRLHISSCRSYPADFFQLNHSIEHLTLEKCKVFLSDKVIWMSISCHLKNLHVLRIYGCGAITHDALDGLVQCCQYLKVLEIRDCSLRSWKCANGIRGLKIFISSYNENVLSKKLFERTVM